MGVGLATLSCRNLATKTPNRTTPDTTDLGGELTVKASVKWKPYCRSLTLTFPFRTGHRLGHKHLDGSEAARNPVDTIETVGRL
ncbi:hypothetical protein DPMN_079794 [Dreissena polymorpha]|uniref:Uncharacterized protein n=1 Tax=Dreissena polymorpha TaxID=45954 RepID=A0A9D4BR95_DREPO|nr:hypothetical protein DPMN_079794 [Dreissena polymorpha]